MKNIFITVLLIFNWCYSDQELTGGLKFYSNYEKPGVGSKLVLPTKGEFNLTKPFSIIFELSIAPTSPYGIILQARNGHETIFSVSYIDFQSEDSSFINLVYGDKDTGIRIPILKDELSVDNWMKLNIEIDPISNSIKLTLNEQLFKNSEIEIRHPLTFNWVFGKPINRNDVPAMGIRDVKFFIEGVEKNYWPLNEFRSEKAKDIVGKKDEVQIQHDPKSITFGTAISDGSVKLQDTDEELGLFNLICSSEENARVVIPINLLEEGTKITLSIRAIGNNQNIISQQTKILTIDNIPIEYALHFNYPNPFNPTTTIRYDLPTDIEVHLVVYDVLGREVKTLVNESQEAGFKSVRWNGRNDNGQQVSAGMYFYRIRAGKFSKVQKMVLLK